MGDAPDQSDATTDPLPADAPIVLFDGTCAMCNGSVRFLLRHERQPWCRFAPLQSDTARGLLEAHGLDPDELNSMVCVEGGRAHLRSDGVLRIAARMRAPYRWARVFRFVPRVIRDAAYRLIAKYRYRVFGTTDACMVPEPAHRDRFLDLA